MARGGGKKYQYCALGEKGCLKPTGTVTWVFCESSEQWFHCICVGVDSKKANDEDFIFICPELKPLKEKVSNFEIWVILRYCGPYDNNITLLNLT